MDSEAERPNALLDDVDIGHGPCKTVGAIEDNSEDSKPVSWRDIKPQILIANIVFAFTLHAGVNLVFSNLILNDFDIHVSSWFASIVGVATPIGACLSGIIMDKCGRKKANIMIAIPCLLSYLLTYQVTRDRVALLYTARFLAGIGGGMTTSNMVYVSEIAHKEYRPIFLSLLTVYSSLGILLTTISKLIFSWRQTALFYLGLFLLITVSIIFCTPESPDWLMNMRRDRTRAKKAVQKLYSSNEVAGLEWKSLSERNGVKSSGFSERREVKYSSRIVYRPFVSLFVLILLQQLSGLYVSLFYVIKIFPALSAVKGKKFNDEAFLISGFIRLIASLAGSCLSARIARKTLFAVSSLGMMLSCVLAICGSNMIFPIFNEEIAILSFLLYISMGSLGVMNIPWTLSAELLPTEVRSTSSTIMVAYGYGLMSIFVKVFPFLLENQGVTFVFAFFGIMSAVLALFMHIFIPETLGKSFNEIERYYAE